MISRPFWGLFSTARIKLFNRTSWPLVTQLMVDAGLLRRASSRGQVVYTVEPERCVSLLVLLALQQLGKVCALQPRVEADHAGWLGYGEGQTITNQMDAVRYMMEHYPHSMPSFEHLTIEQQRVCIFLQTRCELNPGWLIQAEAPPGKVFSQFKSVAQRAAVTKADMSLYFVHWLTDLSPLDRPLVFSGAETFVKRFPQSVLERFIHSWNVVSFLAVQSETQALIRLVKTHCGGKQQLKKSRANAAKEAAGALSILATNSDANRERIAQADGIQPLIGLLENAETATYAAGALHNLAYNHEGNKNAIAKYGGVALLIKLLSSNSSAMQEQAAATLVNLATTTSNKIMIAKSRGLEALVEVLASGSSMVAKEHAVAALVNLCSNQSNKEAFGIVKDGRGVDLMMPLLHEGSELAKERVATAFKLLASAASARKVMFRSGAVAMLQEVYRDNLDKDSGVHLKERAKAALEEIGTHSEKNLVREALSWEQYESERRKAQFASVVDTLKRRMSSISMGPDGEVATRALPSASMTAAAMTADAFVQATMLPDTLVPRRQTEFSYGTDREYAVHQTHRRGSTGSLAGRPRSHTTQPDMPLFNKAHFNAQASMAFECDPSSVHVAHAWRTRTQQRRASTTGT